MLKVPEALLDEAEQFCIDSLKISEERVKDLVRNRSLLPFDFALRYVSYVRGLDDASSLRFLCRAIENNDCGIVELIPAAARDFQQYKFIAPHSFVDWGVFREARHKYSSLSEFHTPGHNKTLADFLRRPPIEVLSEREPEIPELQNGLSQAQSVFFIDVYRLFESRPEDEVQLQERQKQKAKKRRAAASKALQAHAYYLLSAPDHRYSIESLTDDLLEYYNWTGMSLDKHKKTISELVAEALSSQ